MSDPAVINPLPACADCGLAYGLDGWCDIVIPTEIWEIISPTKSRAGLLCFNCIAQRLRIWGFRNVPLMIGSGPFELTPQEYRGCTECASPGVFLDGLCMDHYVIPAGTGIETHREPDRGR